MERDEIDETKDAFAALFDTPQGQKVIKHLTGFMNRTKVDPTDPNPNACVFKQGQDSMMKEIFRMKRYND